MCLNIYSLPDASFLLLSPATSTQGYKIGASKALQPPVAYSNRSAVQDVEMTSIQLIFGCAWEYLVRQHSPVP